MALHIPIIAGGAVAVGVGTTAISIVRGKDTGKAIRDGLNAAKDTAFTLGTLGLIDSDAGIDVSDQGICYDPDHSCDS